MEKINMWMTKKNTFFLAIVGIIFAFGVEFLYQHHFFVSRFTYRFIAEPVAHLSLSLLCVSVVLFFVRDEIFYSWRKFACWWIPLQVVVIVLIIISDKNSAGGFFSAPLKDPVSMFLSASFLVISLFVITTKYISLRESK